MNAEQRRNQIQAVLTKADSPISASVLAKRFSVSRQVIVGDVALLRARGIVISATPRGYVMQRKVTGLIRKIVCRHDTANIEQELYAIVDQGCTVLDVIVDHPVYGQLTGSLDCASRYDVDQFVDRCSKLGALPLSDLTDGIHLHTISCPSEDAFIRTKALLEQLHILYTD